MAVFLLLSIALIFLFVGFIAITYLIASFINEVILKRSDNPKLYITIGFIISFMLFLLFSPLQHLAAMDASVFPACVLLLGECMIFSIAILMQQKYRARISDNVRIIIGMIATGVLMFIFSSFSGTPLSNWSGSISEPVTISPLRHVIENCLIVAVGVWTFIGLKSKYWRAFAGYFLFVYSIFCLNWIASSIAIKISSDPLFLAESSIKGMFFLMYVFFGLFPFILLLVGIYIADKMGFIKRVKEYLTSAIIRILDEEAGGLKRDPEEPGKGKKYASVETDLYYYSVLGVSKNATREEIKDAYHRLAKIYHPDVSADLDAEKKSKEIHKAYEVLSDPDKRAQYDRFEDSYNE